MAISTSYPSGKPIQDFDLFVGTKANSTRTVNYKGIDIADYLNINSRISVLGQLTFEFTTVPNKQKTIAFAGGGGNNTPFSSITKLIVSATDSSGTNITVFLNYLNGSEILLAQQNEPNYFGHYKVTGYTQIGITPFYELDLSFIGGNGVITNEAYYDIASFILSSSIPSLDGYATELWVEDNFVPLSREITINGVTYDLSQDRSWTINSLPSQTGNNGKWLTTDGTNASWQDLPSSPTPTLQEILDNNHDLVDGNNFQGTGAGVDNIGENVNAFGSSAAFDNGGENINALGNFAAENNNADQINALGYSAAAANAGNNVNAFGYSAANNNAGANLNALGQQAGDQNTGSDVNALGSTAAQGNTGDNVNGLGSSAINYNTGNDINAFGFAAAQENIANDVNALGNSAGFNNNYDNVNLFGKNAQADENGQTVLSKDGTIMARISTTDLTETQKYNLPDASGTIALTDDITPSIPKATASGTDTYTSTITGVVAYTDGDAYLVRFTNGNTTGATLNINSLGAKDLYRNNDGLILGGDIQDGAEMLCVYNSTLNGFQCIGTSPNSLFAYVTNADSVTITKGQPVYAFGGTGDRMTVKRALNTSDATSAQTVGLVYSSSIGANQKGLIIMQGLLDGLSILPTSTYSDGDAIYLGATAGAITKTKPYAPNHLVYLGVVTTASNGSAGRMYVRIQNGYEMQELHNVQAQSPSLKDTLYYDTVDSQWKTASIGTILGFTPENVSNKSTTTTLGTSDTLYPTQNAVKTYVDTALAEQSSVGADLYLFNNY